MSTDDLPILKVSTKWITLEIISEADVVLAFKGYAPVLQVKERKIGDVYLLYISARSLAELLEELRKNNDGIFKGIRLRIRKESMHQREKYETEVMS